MEETAVTGAVAEKPAAAEPPKAKWAGVSEAVLAYEEWFGVEVTLQLPAPWAVVCSDDHGQPTPLPGDKDGSPAAALTLMGVMEPSKNGKLISFMYVDPRGRGRDEPRCTKKALLITSLRPEQIVHVTRVTRAPQIVQGEA